MITPAQYFGKKPHNDIQATNAQCLLGSVNRLLDEAHADDCYGYWIDPDTGTQISGSKGGSGDGGFRTSDSKTGAKSSKHRDANAVDVYDPGRKLAQWVNDHKDRLAHHGLYCEDFRWTPTWCHFQRVPPGSGKRIYIPSNTPPLAPPIKGQKQIPHVVKL